MIDENLSSKVKPHIIPDEVLLWVGRPQSGIYSILLFAVVFCGTFLIFMFIPLVHAILEKNPASLNMTINGERPNENTPITLLVESSIMIGFFIVAIGFASIWYFFRLRSQIYALTDQRGLILNKKRLNKVVSITNDRFSELYKSGNSNRGTITFLRYRSHLLMRIYFPKASYLHFKFHKIKNPDEVLTLVYKTFPSKKLSHE